ncbi:Arc-like DNA binding domain protein [Pigmentiphaga humi]|uniref:Arc-like DNA binding domain protein n=1 Tax=Pigmentiphaga humi TaxID=2478468 RepID=A0A3P4B473_9BURK|nr:Arc family DNA-binding protein [Pigmentiphaga humi]VCU70842.1 Arc-like DNA binding domain protein [Pigmentiphaga humi]
MSRSDDKFMLRFPGGMRARLKAQAARNRRSMNAELIILIEAGLQSATVNRSNPGRLPMSSESIHMTSASDDPTISSEDGTQPTDPTEAPTS